MFAWANLNKDVIQITLVRLLSRVFDKLRIMALTNAMPHDKTSKVIAELSETCSWQKQNVEAATLILKLIMQIVLILLM